MLESEIHWTLHSSFREWDLLNLKLLGVQRPWIVFVAYIHYSIKHWISGRGYWKYKCNFSFHRSSRTRSLSTDHHPRYSTAGLHTQYLNMDRMRHGRLLTKVSATPGTSTGWQQWRSWRGEEGVVQPPHAAGSEGRRNEYFRFKKIYIFYSQKILNHKVT